MYKQNLIITSLYNLERYRNNRERVDYTRIQKNLEEKGLDFKLTTFEEVVNNFHHYTSLEQSLIIYTSSGDSEYKAYIEDILLFLSKRNTLIPGYAFLKAHRNKGVQELLKIEKGLLDKDYGYYPNLKNLQKHASVNEYPVVFKLLDGSRGKEVHKITDKNRLESLYQKKYRSTLSTKGKILHLKKVVKGYLVKKHADYETNMRFILQEYIDKPDNDWKVKILNDKFYVFNRKIMKNDFRSGIMTTDLEPTENILNYAKGIYEKLDVPFLSLDIACSSNNCFIIEFSAIDFCTNFFTESVCYYSFENGCWRKNKNRSTLNDEFTASYFRFIQKCNKGGKVCRS